MSCSIGRVGGDRSTARLECRGGFLVVSPLSPRCDGAGLSPAGAPRNHSPPPPDWLRRGRASAVVAARPPLPSSPCGFVSRRHDRRARMATSQHDSTPRTTTHRLGQSGSMAAATSGMRPCRGRARAWWPASTRGDAAHERARANEHARRALDETRPASTRGDATRPASVRGDETRPTTVTRRRRDAAGECARRRDAADDCDATRRGR